MNLSLLLFQSALYRCCCESVTVVVSVCPVQVLLSICHCCCFRLPCARVVVNLSLLLLQSGGDLENDEAMEVPVDEVHATVSQSPPVFKLI